MKAGETENKLSALLPALVSSDWRSKNDAPSSSPHDAMKTYEVLLQQTLIETQQFKPSYPPPRSSTVMPSKPKKTPEEKKSYFF